MKEIKAPASTTTETAKFEVGKVYYLDDDIDFSAIKVVRRTEKNIWFVWQGSVAIDEHRVKIHVENSGETFTYGRYKGAPKFYAVEEFNDDAKKYFTDLYHCWRAPRKAQNIADIMKSINNEVTAEENAAEVKEETEMKEVKAPASATTETVKFEVGKVYYPCVRSENPKIKITKRTAKTVHYKVERHTGEFDCETRANISIWDGVEHFYSGYTSASYYANDAAETATETVETENVVNEEDSATVKTAKEELIYVDNQIKSVQRNIAYYVEQIKEYLGCIAKCENFISNYGVDLHELQNKAAALENEIAHCKLIDVTDEIATADAVDASVAAMETLNAANDFTAANLLDAVNAQAENAVEMALVTFELQNFAEDEDTEIKKQFAEITELAHREKEIEQKIAALQEELNAVHRECVKKDWALTKCVKDLMDEAYKTVKTAFEKRTEFGYIQINGIMMTSWHWDEYNAVRTKFDESGFALWFYDDTAPREYQYTEFVKYSTIKQFKAAISELAEAIERGDKKFTFPADIPPIAEVADNDAEIAKQIWF